jgi:hypothetical protein
MNTNFPTIRKTGRITCAWVPTGDAKAPLACVWMEAEPSCASSTTHASADRAPGAMRLCA